MRATARQTQIIKDLAHDTGFNAVGIARVRRLDEEEHHLQEWLAQGYHGKMNYMANHFEKRLDPGLLVPGAKSVVSLLFNYYPQKDLAQPSEFKIAKYAYGRDYHDVLKAKLRLLLDRAREEIGEINGRVFVDSAPVMERQWAQLAGLGWLGKNGLLLNKQLGSFFFIAELIIDLELEPDDPVTDHCGTCTRCLDACPTDAIVQPGVVDGSRCISYYTIELKAEHPIDKDADLDNWIFGCDVCQDVCPWNRFAQSHSEPEFEPSTALMAMRKKDWEEMTEEVFSQLFHGSAVNRTMKAGLKRNIKFNKLS